MFSPCSAKRRASDKDLPVHPNPSWLFGTEIQQIKANKRITKKKNHPTEVCRYSSESEVPTPIVVGCYDKNISE
jgi:hypothetical protein